LGPPALRIQGFPIPNDVAFSDFAQADNEATVEASLTDGEIIQLITATNVLQAESAAGASLHASFSNNPGCQLVPNFPPQPSHQHVNSPCMLNSKF